MVRKELNPKMMKSPDWAILGHFGSFWVILVILGHFGPFWVILGHSGDFWSFGSFWVI